MKTAQIEYLGNLRTQATHLRSNKQLITDAPVDNNGKGEAFSPTDLVATAMVSCMITVMGIHAERNGLSMGKVTGEVQKVMASAPRRIERLDIVLQFHDSQLSNSEKRILENIALNCPVAKSVHPDMNVQTKFQY